MMWKRFMVLAIACAWLFGCATQTSLAKASKALEFAGGPFRGEWWNYYERGAASNAAESYQQAELDLRKAVSGRTADTWRARTYGLHFVEYFPNRELGVACYHLGHLDDAESYLSISLKQTDTERAHHYLDLVKRARIAKGELIDENPPALGASISSGAVLATREIPLNIRATDTLGVSAVRVNGEPLHQRGSALELDVRKNLVLEEGTQVITVEANNLAGKTSSQSLTVSVDVTGPAIGIFEPPADLVTDSSTIRLRGVSVDASGLSSVKLGSQSLSNAKGARHVDFDTELQLNDGTNTFVIIATDVAGNETRSAVSVFKGSREKTAAFLLNLPDRLLEPLRFAHVRFSAPPTLFSGLAARAHAAAVTDAPSGLVIDLKYPKADGVSHKKEVRVAGKVTSTGTVAAVKVNNLQCEYVAAPVCEFSKRISLKEGENVFQVMASDDSGNQARKDVTVVGKPFDLDAIQGKMGAAVLDFGGAVDEAMRERVRKQTTASLLAGRRFDVVDRDHLPAVLQEQQLSAALGDPSRALRLKKLIPANIFLSGKVIEWGKGIEVFTEVINTETSLIVYTFDTHIDEKSDVKAIAYGMDSIAEYLSKVFPRISGDVVKVEGKNLILNFGKDDGVREGMHVLVVHQEEASTNSQTGEILVEGEYETLGEAAITKADDKASRAKTLRQEGDAKLEAGMPAVTM